MRENKAITLIALVVTIIVLLILASVSLNLVLGEHGIITMAKKAKENMELAQVDEQTALNSLYEQLYGNNIGGSGNSGDTQGGGTNTPNPQGSQLKNYLKQEGVAQNTTVYDEYNNSVVIPKGFHIVTPEEDETVEYSYTGKENIPSVQDGIVVEDSDGNQFVWVPVGEVHDKTGDTTTITLGRYEEDHYTGNAEDARDGTYKIEYLGDYFTEDTPTQHTRDNMAAINITNFIDSANTKKGYYIARYEASYDGEGNKPLSQPSTSYDARLSGTAPTTKRQLWNFITQIDAAEKSRAMYDENNQFISDLVNSYSWDTAIVFIQKYSPENADYAIQTSNSVFTGSISNTGERTDGTTDKVCNIYDMADNCMEWSTETCETWRKNCGSRGGYANSGNGNRTLSRYGRESDVDTSNLSFRVILYIK